MDMEWSDKKTKLGEARKCHARLPGNMGWINLTEYDGAGYRHGRGFALHYTATEIPGGLPPFSGMLFLKNWAGGMDALKASAMDLMAKDMARKIAAYKAKIEGVRIVMDACGARTV